MKQGILFDLDGTLWDSAQAVVDSWNEIIETLPDFHKLITNEDMCQLMGKTMDDIAYTYFNTVSKERALEILQVCMDHENDYIEQHGGVLFPGLEDVLKELSEKYDLFIVSNCQLGYIEAFLSYHKLGKYFKDTECYGRTKRCKGDSIAILLGRQDLEQAVYVGDIEGDFISATQAGLPFIHAAYGFGKVPQAAYAIRSIQELPAMVQKVFAKKDIRAFLHTQKLITDGAFGTYFSSICQNGIFPERANTQAPALVKQVHEAYLSAGAQLIRTNTFAANTKTLDMGLDEVLETIEAGFTIAKEAAEPYRQKHPVFLAGDIGPIPGGRQEQEEQITEEYLQIARKFVALGADLLVFETFPNPDQILPVIRQIRKESPIFILVQFAVNQLGYSVAGISARSLLEEAGQVTEIDAAGLNCGVGPGHMYNIIKQVSSLSGKYLSVLPNASYPKVVQDRLVFLENMDYFADKMVEIADLGASIIGGCCGTNPDYIRRLVKALGEKHLRAEKPSPVHITVKERTEQAEDHSFYAGKRGKLIAVELSPPPSANDQKLLEAAHLLSAMHVDTVTFPDSPSGRTRADSILMAAKVARETDLCVMPHICCRDKNAIAIRSQLLGAYLSDIRNALVITGDPVPSMAREDVRSVFNFDSVGLMKLIQEMNREEFASDLFFVGGAINQNRLRLDVEINRVKRKMEHGATFFMTQPVFTKEEIDKIRRIKEETGARILCGIMPLVSRKNALFIKNEMTGMCVTDEIVARFADGMSRSEGEAAGCAIAREMMALAADFADGYYFSIPFNRVYLLHDMTGVINESGKEK